jgi:hypothetical protein
MSDRLVRGIVAVLLALMLLPLALSLLSPLVGGAVRALANELAGSLLGGVVSLCFILGLLVRLMRLGAGNTPEHRRRREAEARRSRLAVRRRSEDVPAVGGVAEPEDEDDRPIDAWEESDGNG